MRGRARRGRRALAHWWGIQGLNAFWMWLGFGQRLRGAAALEAAATVVNAAAYVETARKVDRAGGLAGGALCRLDRLRGAAERGVVAAEPVARIAAGSIARA